MRGGAVERLIFGGAGEADVAALVDAHCRRTLGAGVRERLWTRTSVGVVFGLELDDGRRVVLKAHQPRQSLVSLQVVHATQTMLARQGFPCPRPLAEPALLAHGAATVDELVDAGSFADAHRPPVRRAMAAALADLLALTRPLGAPPALRTVWSLWDGAGLWPPSAHSPIFDFAATATGAGWIDEVARAAKRAGDADDAEFVVHTDWSAKHLRFDADLRVTVVYDWDLRLGTEAQAVGTAAATFTATEQPGVPLAPSPDEVAAFVDDYAAARASAFSADERRAALAVAAYVLAYTARCEHALGRRGDFTSALAAHGPEYLARAGAA